MPFNMYTFNKMWGLVTPEEAAAKIAVQDETYYPVNDAKNGALYSWYKEMAASEKNVIFGGRLGEYKYYDMDQVIAAALEMCGRELGQR